MPAPKLVTYDGRTQSCVAWDREIGRPYGTVSKRIRYGWPIEEVLELVPHKRMVPETISRAPRLYTIGDLSLSSKEWAENTGVTPRTFLWRFKNWRPEAVLAGRPPLQRIPPKVVIIDGRRLTVTEAAEELGISPGTIYSRLQRGFTGDEVPFGRKKIILDPCVRHPNRRAYRKVLTTDGELRLCQKCGLILSRNNISVASTAHAKKLARNRANAAYAALSQEERTELYRERSDYVKEWKEEHPGYDEARLRKYTEERRQRFIDDPEFKYQYMQKSIETARRRRAIDPEFAEHVRSQCRLYHRRKQQKKLQSFLDQFSSEDQTYINEILDLTAEEMNHDPAADDHSSRHLAS